LKIEAALLVLIAVGYAVAYFQVPWFGRHTRLALEAIGLDEMRFDPGCRDLIERDGRVFLWGGPEDRHDFDVTESRLDLQQIHYGMGREHFAALIEPGHITAADADERLASGSLVSLTAGLPGVEPPSPEVVKEGQRRRMRVLVVEIGDEVKVYPLDTLRRHEVVNDVVGGVPIFVAYCYLADLGAAYHRRRGDHTLTFALTGYTYFDPDVWDGRDAFLLWDRDTESIWWPPVGRAVAGPLMDAPLELLDESLWSQTTWDVAFAQHPDALVLEEGQTLEAPEDWPRLDVETPTTRPAGAMPLAPRWGKNTP